MCLIEELHKYVPDVPLTRKFEPSASDSVIYEDYDVHQILLGGDQLTVSRARSSRDIRSNENASRDRSASFVPVIEDWHAHQTFMKLSLQKNALPAEEHH
jgi:hypothetical protein